MKYLCLVYIDPHRFKSLTPRADAALTEESLAYDEELKQKGHYLVSQTLQSIQTAITLRVRNGKLSISDGPFAATSEQLGGFILIDARDLNEAIQVASRIPMARVGSIEVRPILD